MKKLNILELFERGSEVELGVGARIVDQSGVVDIQKESIELAIVLKGVATIIHAVDGKKEVVAISEGGACFFNSDDECVMLQKGAVVLLVDKDFKRPEPASSSVFGFFGKKPKPKSPEILNSEEVEKKEIEQEKSILSDMMPKVQQAWYQVAGPLSESIVNDESRFKAIAGGVYSVLPMPIRMIVKEDFFVSWCYEKRHILLVEASKMEEAEKNELLPELDLVEGEITMVENKNGE